MSTTSHGGNRRGSTLTWLVILVIAVAIAAFVACHVSTGANSPRIANPNVVGAPRPVAFLLGPDFIQLMQCGTVVMMVTTIIWCAIAWRRHPAHPYLLMILASTAIIWQDPIMNWAPYAVYNPQLWHLPTDWPLARLSPTVEPLVVVGYAPFYFVVPFFASNAILRRFQARASSDSFVWRHPLLSLGLLLFMVGFVFDAILEIFCVEAGLDTYAQVVPWGSINVGTPFQFPLIWESGLITLVMIPAGVLCYRDDTGRTVAEKLAQRLRWFSNRPALATFLVMFGILNIGYFAYGGGYVAIRASGKATALACPYPYPEAKVYDPQGYFEREGEPGPYFQGFWNTWQSGNGPEGRPTVNPVKADGSCRRKP